MGNLTQYVVKKLKEDRAIIKADPLLKDSSIYKSIIKLISEELAKEQHAFHEKWTF